MHIGYRLDEIKGRGFQPDELRSLAFDLKRERAMQQRDLRELANFIEDLGIELSIARQPE